MVSLPLATPSLQVSVESLESGESLPVHEKPYESPVQPETLSSAMQVDEENVKQQYSLPPLTAVGSLQSRVESGVAVPVHE
jgi:hypothetical protein